MVVTIILFVCIPLRTTTQRSPLSLSLSLLSSSVVVFSVGRRIAKKAPLNKWDYSTFFGGSAKGYTDYPTMDA